MSGSTVNNSSSSHDELSCYGYSLMYNLLSRANFIIIGAFYICGSILSITFNTLFLVTMKRNRRLRKLSNYLLSCLSVIDMLSGILIMPIGAAVLIGRYHHVRFCTLEMYLSSLGYSIVFMSFILVFVITLEQYLAIVQPFYHQNNVTLPKLLTPVCSTWPLFLVTCTICTIVGNRTWLLFQNALGIVIFLTYVAIFYCYAKIFKVAQRMRRRITVTSNTVKDVRQNSRQGQQNKTVKTTGLIILAFTLCYIPIALYTIRRYLVRETPMERTILYEWAQLIATWTAVANPLVYCWRLKVVRKELCKFCGIKGVGKKNSVSFYKVQESIKPINTEAQGKPT